MLHVDAVDYHLYAVNMNNMRKLLFWLEEVQRLCQVVHVLGSAYV